MVLAALAFTVGCGGRRGQPVDNAPYRGVEQGALFAWAWGGAPGFRDDDAHDTVVLFHPEPGDVDHRLASCDPSESACKSLSDFRDTGRDPDFDDDTLFGEFDTDLAKADRLFLVVARRGGLLVTSDVISATAGSRPTGYARRELRFDRRSHEIAWPRLPGDLVFVLEVVDERSGQPMAAVATRRKSWVYPEIQGVIEYFHDAAAVSDLRPEREYVVVLYAINRQGWTTLVTEATVEP